MGVRGLTSFIAQRAEQYLMPYELHDCNLIIDGDNLACNLYKDVTGTYSAFGGDYDDFYRAVIYFFTVLKECNVQPFVLCDGGYEERKLHTVATRLRGKIAVIKRINPCGSIPVFPVMIKEVFVDAVRDSGVPIMRCVFEADDELAALGRKLCCPVLSYDSDFYIYNVRYIPLVTLTIKAHTKVLKDVEKSQEKRCLRKNEAKHVEKRMKAHCIVNKKHMNSSETSKEKTKKKSYKYLDCCIYRIEHLVARGTLSKEKLPLFAALLGNDYIARSAFKNFFAVSLGKGGRSRKMKQQQKRIKIILQWLRTESVQSALEKILSRLKMSQRESLQAQVNAAISGYSNEKCISYDFFAANYAEALNRYPPKVEDDDKDCVYSNDYEDVEEEETEEDSNTEEEEDTESGPYIDETNVNMDKEKNLVEKVDELDQVKDTKNENEEKGDVDSSEQTKNDNENEEKGDVDSSEETENDNENEEKGDVDSSEQTDNDNENEEKGETDQNDVGDNINQFPSWFLEKLYPANLPRFLVDLLHLRKYINSPQIEHFPYSDCNEVALPILIYIFTLINSVQGEEAQLEMGKDGTPHPIEFTYLTRTVRVTNILYKRMSMVPEIVKYPFNPREPNKLILRQVFEQISNLDVTLLFTNLDVLPSNLRLYFLAIVYWLHRSSHYDVLHLHALLLCLVVLQTVDSKIPAERNLSAFQKRFGKIIRTERQVRDKEFAQGIKRAIKPELLDLSIPERIEFIPKSDCYLVQNNLLKHFHMQEIFKKKYDLFSTTVLHGFAEFQAVVFQLHALNGLLDFPYESPRMGQLYCGVFIYNLYDLLKSRTDIQFYVEKFLLQDSKMMFDYYNFLYDWCKEFIPLSKRSTTDNNSAPPRGTIKKVLKKQRQAARKKAEQLNAHILLDPNSAMVKEEQLEGDEYHDLNNKFCTLLKIQNTK